MTHPTDRPTAPLFPLLLGHLNASELAPAFQAPGIALDIDTFPGEAAWTPGTPVSARVTLRMATRTVTVPLPQWTPGDMGAALQALEDGLKADALTTPRPTQPELPDPPAVAPSAPSVPKYPPIRMTAQDEQCVTELMRLCQYLHLGAFDLKAVEAAMQTADTQELHPLTAVETMVSLGMAVPVHTGMSSRTSRYPQWLLTRYGQALRSESTFQRPMTTDEAVAVFTSATAEGVREVVPLETVRQHLVDAGHPAEALDAVVQWWSSAKLILTQIPFGGGPVTQMTVTTPGKRALRYQADLWTMLDASKPSAGYRPITTAPQL